MKYSANQRHISSFVVGRAGSESGLPVADILKALANRRDFQAVQLIAPHQVEVCP